jgi:hypothetical protein
MYNNVEQFKDWWLKAGRPLRPPFENAIHTTDIAYAVCLYREGRYQVELYIIKPNSETPMHAHPGISQMTMFLTGNMSFSREAGVFRDLFEYNKPKENGSHHLLGVTVETVEGVAHAVKTHKEGGAFLVFEHWHDKDPTSVAINWEGELVGDQHAQTIQSYQ